jgi:hypothetical protein
MVLSHLSPEAVAVAEVLPQSRVAEMEGQQAKTVSMEMDLSLLPKEVKQLVLAAVGVALLEATQEIMVQMQ